MREIQASRNYQRCVWCPSQDILYKIPGHNWLKRCSVLNESHSHFPFFPVDAYQVLFICIVEMFVLHWRIKRSRCPEKSKYNLLMKISHSKSWKYLEYLMMISSVNRGHQYTCQFRKLSTNILMCNTEWIPNFNELTDDDQNNAHKHHWIFFMCS